MIGRQISHYEIRASLGAGGMGEVYKAWDTTLDRWVALKFLPPAAATQPEIRQRFVREAKAASAVEHPNVCAIHEIGETDDGQLFICMAFCEGRTLAKTLEEGPLDEAQALDVAGQILSGLERAHHAGVVHRDLKPGNVMIAPDGSVRLVDFGLAKLDHADGLTRAGTAMGTLGYMSPEQVRGEDAGPESDLWSLGVILLEMLTAKRAFRRDNVPSTLKAILEEEPEQLSSLPAEVSAATAAAIARLLAKEPRARFRSAADAMAALPIESGAYRPATQPVSTMETELALPVPNGAPASRWRRKRYAFALVAALAATVITATVMRTAPDRSGATRLAVLPFANLTGDASRTYLSDGLAAGLITSLGELGGLKVFSRAEAWGQRGKPLGAVELAHRLGAELLVAGVLQQDGEVLVVDVELLDAEGSVLFSQEFRGGADEAMVLQKRIGGRLADILEIPLNQRERARLSDLPTSSYRAFDFYLRGQQELDKARSATSGSSLGEAGAAESAISLFDQAIRLDERFALAHVGLSEGYWQIAQRDRSAQPLTDARRAAEKALEIDSSLPAALVAMARLARGSGNPSAAIARLQEALEDHPHPAEALRELGQSYEAANDIGAAERAFRAATLVDEDNWLNWNALGSFWWRLGRYEDAQTAFERAAREAPEKTVRPRENLATLEISRGNFDAAIDGFEAIEGPVRSAILASNMGTAYYFSQRPGHLEKARDYYRLAERLNPRDDDVQRNLADLLLRLGEREEAMEHYRIARTLVETQLESDPESHELRLRRSFYAAKGEDCELAREVIERLRPELPRMAQNAHRTAYVFALCDQPVAALEELRRAIELGVSPDLIRSEDEFAALREQPEFRRMVGLAGSESSASP